MLQCQQRTAAGAAPRRGPRPATDSSRRGVAAFEHLAEHQVELLDYVNIARLADYYKARTLSHGDQRRLEIARALATLDIIGNYTFQNTAFWLFY